MTFPMSPSRRACAVYADFSRPGGIRRKRGLPVAGVWNIRPPGSAANRIGASGDLEIPHASRRIFARAPSRWVGAVDSDSLDLEEFGEDFPYLGAVLEI